MLPRGGYLFTHGQIGQIATGFLASLHLQEKKGLHDDALPPVRSSLNLVLRIYGSFDRKSVLFPCASHPPRADTPADPTRRDRIVDTAGGNGDALGEPLGML